jgi:hypothetical protein
MSTALHGINTLYTTACWLLRANKGNNKITELRTILQRESQNS